MPAKHPREPARRAAIGKEGKMKEYEIYKSEGGYRVAANIINGGPVISYGLGKKWFARKSDATSACKKLKKQREATHTQY